MSDPILYWNDVALEANRVSHSNGKGEQTGPTLSARALAIVHLAMYDAFAGIGRLQSPPLDLPEYLPGIAPPTTATASIGAAVAAAADATLSALFPSQRAFFNKKHLEADVSGGDVRAGHAFGLRVAAAILKDRKDDPDASDRGYAVSSARGAHRPDPDNPDQGVYAPFYGARSRCFAAQVRHSLDVPPQPGDPEYVQALQQVRALGIQPQLTGTLPKTATPRTPDQTLIGLYWGYDGANGLGTPPRLYNQIVRQVAVKRGNTAAQNARLFALVNAAMADAGILCWEQKYLHDLWRPVLGIREQDESMGPGGIPADSQLSDCDPNWLPLGAPNTNSTNKNFTPNFPAYPSGHATFGAAALQVTRLFYGKNEYPPAPDDLFEGEYFVSEELNGMNKDNTGTVRPRHARPFPGGLWQMIKENGISRVYLGVHWVFDAFHPDKKGNPDLKRNVGGVPLGLCIAKDIFESGLKRTPK